MGKITNMLMIIRVNFVEMEFMPQELKQQVFYKPQQNAAELKLLERLKAWWKKKY